MGALWSAACCAVWAAKQRGDRWWHFYYNWLDYVVWNQPTWQEKHQPRVARWLGTQHALMGRKTLRKW
jgi:hypothetical protein